MVIDEADISRCKYVKTLVGDMQQPKTTVENLTATFQSQLSKDELNKLISNASVFKD